MGKIVSTFALFLCVSLGGCASVEPRSEVAGDLLTTMESHMDPVALNAALTHRVVLWNALRASETVNSEDLRGDAEAIVVIHDAHVDSQAAELGDKVGIYKRTSWIFKRLFSGEK